MFINNFDPVALEIFSLEIRWYSLAYIMGILIGWFLAKKFLIGKNIYTRFDDYITYVIIGLILGGRIGYVLFYNLGFYINNPLDVFKLWQGGMSFHGGVLGIIIASILFAKKNNDDVFEYLDVIALVAPIGIFFGRLANFINSELYGYETNLPWGVKFVQVDDLYRHPTQLYEAFFEGFVLFFVLLFFKKKERFKIAGILSSFFLIFYSIFRFIIEYFRVPDEQLGYLILNATMGQIISFVFFVAGIFLFFSKINVQKKT
jgi:phosphatidylglycerol:prolipoprotein diacylglycerol transferase